MSDDMPGPDGLVGTTLSADTVRRGVHERTSPGLDVVVESIDVDGTELLRITVPEGLEVYGTTTGRYSWRRGTDCLPLTADDVGRLREERRGEDWSARSARSGGIEVVDPTAIARIRELLAGVGRPAASALLHSDDRELVSALGLTTPHEFLTHAGELLLGPATSSPTQRSSTSTGGCLPESRSAPLDLSGGQQVAIPDFPLGAVPKR